MRQPFNRHRGGEMAWEKKELIKNILIIILLSGAFILFISRTGQGGTQKYFEGEVLENNGGYITIEVNLQYNDLRKMGLEHFDNWASIFGETVTAMELSPERNKL